MHNRQGRINKVRKRIRLFDNKNELEARQEILGIVDEYCRSTITRNSIRKATEYHMPAEYMTARK